MITYAQRVKMMGLEENLKDIQEGFAKLRKKVVFKGYLTPEQRDELAKSLL